MMTDRAEDHELWNSIPPVLDLVVLGGLCVAEVASQDLLVLAATVTAPRMELHVEW